MALAVVPVGFDLPDGPHLSELRKIGGRTLLEICLKELSDAGQTVWRQHPRYRFEDLNKGGFLVHLID